MRGSVRVASRACPQGARRRDRAIPGMEPGPTIDTAAPSAVKQLLDLPDELLERVFAHLTSIRDFGRAGCVCHAWRKRDSPVARALYQRIKKRGGAVSAAAEKGSTTTMISARSE